MGSKYKGGLKGQCLTQTFPTDHFCQEPVSEELWRLVAAQHQPEKQTCQQLTLAGVRTWGRISCAVGV